MQHDHLSTDPGSLIRTGWQMSAELSLRRGEGLSHIPNIISVPVTDELSLDCSRGMRECLSQVVSQTACLLKARPAYAVPQESLSDHRPSRISQGGSLASADELTLYQSGSTYGSGRSESFGICSSPPSSSPQQAGPRPDR